MRLTGRARDRTHSHSRGDNAYVSKARVPLAGRSIALLDVSTRGRYCLENAGVRTIGDLLHWSAGELLRARNLGRTTLKEIVDKLARLGLELKPEGAWPPRVPESITDFGILRYPEIASVWEHLDFETERSLHGDVFTARVEAGQLVAVDPLPFADGTIVQLLPLSSPRHRAVADGDQAARETGTNRGRRRH